MKVHIATLKEGKYHGRYYDEYAGIDVNYDMGVLHGKYSARQEDGSLKEGEYNRGEFTGTVTSKDGLKVEQVGENISQFTGTITSKDGLTVESWIDGKLDCTTTYESAEVNRWTGKVESHGRVTSVVRPNGECCEYKNGKLVK